MGLKTAVLLKEVRSDRQKETEMEKNVELCQSDMTVKIQSVIFSVLSIYFYLFHQAKIEKISRPDMMSLTSAERKSKEAKRK